MKSHSAVAPACNHVGMFLNSEFFPKAINILKMFGDDQYGCGSLCYIHPVLAGLIACTLTHGMNHRGLETTIEQHRDVTNRLIRLYGHSAWHRS